MMMEKHKQRWSQIALAMCIVLMIAVAVFGGQSKYKSGTTSAAVTFGPARGELIVKSVYATTDKAGGTVKVYARTGNKFAPTTSPTNGATVIAIANTATVVTNGDHVVYCHVNGTLDYTTVSSATTTNVTLAAGITVAGATGDYLYEIAQAAQLDFDTAGAGVGTNKYGKFEGTVYTSPGGSPIYVVLDGTSNCVVNVTVQ